MQNENFFTRDIYLSATLLSLKFSLINISTQIEGFHNASIGYFGFQQSPELAEVEKKYWARQIALEPVEFIKNLYELKAEVSNSFNRKVKITGDERDIYFAAALLTLRFNLLNIDYKIDKFKRQLIGFFKFEETPQLVKARKEYLNKELVIEPILFISNLRGLKSQLANIYKSPHTNMEKFEKI